MKKNGTTAVAAPKGATETKGQILVVKPAHGEVKPNPELTKKLAEEGKGEEPPTPAALAIVKPLTAEERLKALPSLQALAKKITLLTNRLATLREMKAAKTGEGEKMVLHLGDNHTLTVENGFAIDKIINMIIEGNEEKLATANNELATFNY
jgi:ferric-dicitrate binding protein FerR (iron transport regulator)